jgi:hypothetical protein
VKCPLNARAIDIFWGCAIGAATVSYSFPASEESIPKKQELPSFNQPD